MDAELSNFEDRRTTIWVVNRWLVYACIVACTLLLTFISILDMPAQFSWTAGVLATGLIALTVGRAARALHVLYRCPNCGTLPYRTLNEYKCGGRPSERLNDKRGEAFARHGPISMGRPTALSAERAYDEFLVRALPQLAS